MSGYERGRIMSRFADLIDENIEELAALDTIDAGKLFSWGKALDIPRAASLLRFYAGAADKVHGEVLKMKSELHAFKLHEPISVVGHIIPWNFPSNMFSMKVSPALAAGCTMVVKHAEQTPLSALFYAHPAKKAGIPDGVINFVTSFGSTAGAAITNHMDIAMVSFTGSMKVGRLVMQAADASNLKPVSLELGGKSPLLVFDDADVDTATDIALLGVLYNKVDKKQFEKILSCIEHGKREGATLLTGGEPLDTKGFYIQPTIFTNVLEDMLIAKDEIFGPVMSLMKFKRVYTGLLRRQYGEPTAPSMASQWEFLTKDINVANTVSRLIRAGIIWINCYFAFDNDLPYGGCKISGFRRDMGLEALRKYLHVKSVVTPIFNAPWL